APHQLGAGGAPARLRPGAVRVHRYESRSAHPRSRAPAAPHLRRAAPRPAPGGPDGREPDRLGALAREARLHDPRSRLAALPGQEGAARVGGWRTGARAARDSGGAPRHALHGRPCDRAPLGAGRPPLDRAPLAAAPAPALGGPRALQRALRPGLAPGLRARGERRARGGAAPLAALLPLARALPRARERAPPAPSEGQLLRPDERGRPPARAALRLARGARPLGLDARALHLRPRRADGRPLDARQGRLLRPVLPRPADRARPAAPGPRRAVGRQLDARQGRLLRPVLPRPADRARPASRERRRARARGRRLHRERRPDAAPLRVDRRGGPACLRRTLAAPARGLGPRARGLETRGALRVRF